MSYTSDLDKLLPGWAKNNQTTGLFALPIMLIDSFIDQAIEGVVRYMGADPPIDAIPHIENDRGLIRGFLETPAQFGARATRWRQTALNAGNRETALKQLAALFQPSPPLMRIVMHGGVPPTDLAVWVTRELDGSFTYDVISPCNFNWDNHWELWARWWVIIYQPTTPPWGTEGQWGDLMSMWETGDGVWGLDVVAEWVDRLRRVVDAFRPETVRVEAIILPFDPASFDPAGSGVGYPDGTWGKNYKIDSGIVVPTRLESARYITGTDDVRLPLPDLGGP